MIVMTISNGSRSAFKEIEELSQKLLAKSAVARFVDKGEDSKVVVGLVERLREAIVCYQVGENSLWRRVLLTDQRNRYRSSKQSTIRSLTWL